MRFITFAAFHGVLCAGAAAAMHPASGTIELRATATFSDGSTADRVYKLRSDADSDGDGVGDENWLRVACDKGIATAIYVHSVKSPRDAASGMASGKRQHKPFTITKEWGAKTAGGEGSGADDGVIGRRASWDLATMTGGKAGDPTKNGYDIKKVEGARTGYDVKKVEGTGARVDHSGASDASAGKGAHGKTMAHDDWHAATLAAGSPNLCS